MNNQPMASIPLAFLQELMDLHHDVRCGRLVPATPTATMGNLAPATPPKEPAPRGVGETRQAATVLSQMGLFPGYEVVHDNDYKFPEPSKAEDKGEGDE